MGELIKFPQKDKVVSVDDIVESLKRLNLPAEISEQVSILVRELKKLKEHDSLTCRIYLQDLSIYGDSFSEAGKEFAKKHHSLASKISSLPKESWSAINNILK